MKYVDYILLEKCFQDIENESKKKELWADVVEYLKLDADDSKKARTWYETVAEAFRENGFWVMYLARRYGLSSACSWLTATAKKGKRLDYVSVWNRCRKAMAILRRARELGLSTDVDLNECWWWINRILKEEHIDEEQGAKILKAVIMDWQNVTDEEAIKEYPEEWRTWRRVNLLSEKIFLRVAKKEKIWEAMSLPF